MPAIQALMGSLGSTNIGGNALPEPGGWYTYINNQVDSSIKWKIYNAYHNESTDVSGFTLVETGTAVPNLAAGEPYRTYMFTGYMMLPVDGNYIFRVNSDDGSYVWIGSLAYSGYTINNALINNGGLHGPQDGDSPLINMKGGVWYPIRILFGNLEGGTYLTFNYTVNSLSWAPPTWAHNSATDEGFN